LKSRIINSFVGYFSDRMYSFSGDVLEEKRRDENIKVVILARHHYIERNVEFPISLKKDVKAAVAFEAETLQNEFFVLSKIAKQSEGKTRVTFWQIPKNIMPEGVAVVLPESYLLSHLINEQQLLVYKALADHQDVYLALSDKGIQSRVGQGQSKELFCHAAGINIKQELIIKPGEFTRKLRLVLKLAFNHLLSDFWLNRKTEKLSWFEQIKPYVLPVSFFITLYMVLSSAYLSYQLNSAQEQVENRKTDIDKVLTVQREMNELKDEIEEYQSIGASKQALWKIWQILSPLYKKGVTFHFVRFNGEYILFRASADSASSVLEYMLQSPHSEQAEFTTAVRKKGDEESFIIRFKLKYEGVTNEA